MVAIVISPLKVSPYTVRNSGSPVAEKLSCKGAIIASASATAARNSFKGKVRNTSSLTEYSSNWESSTVTSVWMHLRILPASKTSLLLRMEHEFGKHHRLMSAPRPVTEKCCSHSDAAKCSTTIAEAASGLADGNCSGWLSYVSLWILVTPAQTIQAD